MRSKIILFLIFAFAAGFSGGFIFLKHRYAAMPSEKSDATQKPQSGASGTPSPTQTPEIPMLPGLTDIAKQNTSKIARQMQALGYMSGYEKAPEQKGVDIYKPDSCANGLNLVISSHAPEAKLMDMQGNVVHKWSCSIHTAFPELKIAHEDVHSRCWRRVHLYPDGTLLAIFNQYGLIKLDRNSHILWALQVKCHHDLDVDSHGNIYVLAQKEHIISSVNAKKPVIEELILKISPEGKQISSVSLLEALQNSKYSPLLNFTMDHGDILHANTLSLLHDSPGALNSAFSQGNILTSFRHLDTIAILDWKQEKIVWALTGLWHLQHEPEFLSNGNILVFDNQGTPKHSKVIEINPLTQEIVWEYTGGSKLRFFSGSSGSLQRLSNGNTLIIQSNGGRAFEVTPGKNIVWQFFNPERTGKHNEMIAVLFNVHRLEKRPDWLD